MRVRIFTDGACSGNPGPGGWGFVVNLKDSCKTCKGYELDTTNNRMELKGIVESLKNVLKNRRRLEEIEMVEIYSDSAYAINAINRGWLKKWQLNGWQTTNKEDVKNRDLWEQLLQFVVEVQRCGVEPTFNKIKGHAGHTFNELADDLAKEGTILAKEELAKKAGGEID